MRFSFVLANGRLPVDGTMVTVIWSRSSFRGCDLRVCVGYMCLT